MKTLIVATFIGVVVGSGAGWLYWKNFGCNGNCLITSKPFHSTIYGAFAGGLLFYSITGLFINSRNKHK